MSRHTTFDSKEGLLVELVGSKPAAGKNAEIKEAVHNAARAIMKQDAVLARASEAAFKHGHGAVFIEHALASLKEMGVTHSPHTTAEAQPQQPRIGYNFAAISPTKGGSFLG